MTAMMIAMMIALWIKSISSTTETSSSLGNVTFSNGSMDHEIDMILDEFGCDFFFGRLPNSQTLIVGKVSQCSQSGFVLRLFGVGG